MQIFNLVPTNGRKSFGNKCKVIVHDKEAKLISYDTNVAIYNIETGVYTELLNNSVTTNGHIKAFKQFYNI